MKKMKSKPKPTARIRRHILGLIELRIHDNQKALEFAIANKAWSEVSGLYGIGTGLRIARKIVVEEFAV